MYRVLLPLVVAGGALALGACTTQPTHQPKAQKVTQNQGKYKVCTSHSPLGSHIVKSHCYTMTAAQYKAYKKALRKRTEEDRKKIQEMQRKGAGSSGSEGGP